MGCALILYHGSIKERGFSRRAERQRIWFAFSLNALDEVQEKFGGYDKLSEVFNKDNPNLFKDTRWLLTLLINEALLAEDENAQLLEEKRVGRLIHAGNLQEVQNAILNRSTEEQRETTATQRTKTTEKKQQKRETGQPCRKIRYCTAFVYCSSAFEIQGT